MSHLFFKVLPNAISGAAKKIITFIFSRPLFRARLFIVRPFVYFKIGKSGSAGAVQTPGKDNLPSEDLWKDNLPSEDLWKDNLPSEDLFWQPLWLVVVKGVGLAIIVGWLFRFYPVVGDWMQSVVGFFRLQEIYNFTLPSRAFFHDISRYLFIAVLGYYGLWATLHILTGFLSYCYTRTDDRKIYIVKNSFLKKESFLIAAAEMELVAVKQYWPLRWLGLGTLVFHKASGEVIEVNSLGSVSRCMRQISFMKSV